MFLILDKIKLIKTIQKKLILSSTLTILLVTLFGMTQPHIFADETDEKQYTKANDITIYTIFGFGDVIEESYGFQVYTQISGFDRSLGNPTFKLKGVMGFDRVYLYEAVDMISKRGIYNTQQKYGQFVVDVYLQKDDITLRHFKYADCTVSDYKVTTLFDKEEGWTTSKGFATIDEFEFECSGYKSNNPLFDLMKNQ